MYEWDDAKRRANIAKHGVDFAAAADFEWDTAVMLEDRDQAHGERRDIAIGFIAADLHVLTYTLRGEATRVISLRRATRYERRIYEEANS